MKTDINSDVWIQVGGLASMAINGTIVNVQSNVSFDNRQTGNTDDVLCKIGGLVGHIGGSSSIIKCSYNGNLYFRGSTSNVNGNDVQLMGGIVGCSDGNVTIDQCAVTGNISEEFNGPNIGGIIGRILNTSNYVIKLTNVVLNVNVKCIGTCTSPDVGLIHGWSSNQNLNTTNGSTISNINIVGGATYYNTTTPTYYLSTPSSPMTDASKFSNINLPIASGVTVYPSAFNTAGCTQKKGSTAAVVTEANKNSSITNNFSVSSSGAVTSKLSTFLSTL